MRIDFLSSTYLFSLSILYPDPIRIFHSPSIVPQNSLKGKVILLFLRPASLLSFSTGQRYFPAAHEGEGSLDALRIS
jgi:hypothetical protein